MKKVITFLSGLLLFGSTLSVSAQEKVEVTLSADVVSRYVWRGLDLGHASVQPTLGIGWKGLSLSAWGSVGITNSDDCNEVDLTASYTTGGLTVGVVDYWCDDPESRYFYYNAHGTSHVFEAFASYDFGVLSASWQTMFAGNDGINKNGKRAYSSYLELMAPFRLATCDWEAALGVVPYATTYYDTTGFAVTNVALKATKELKVTDYFSLPLFAQLAGNPCSQHLYFVFGITLTP